MNSPLVTYGQFLPLILGTTRPLGTGPHHDPEVGQGDAPGAGYGSDGSGTSFTPGGLAQSKAHHPPSRCWARGSSSGRSAWHVAGVDTGFNWFCCEQRCPALGLLSDTSELSEYEPAGNGRPAEPQNKRFIPSSYNQLLAQGPVRDRGGE